MIECDICTIFFPQSSNLYWSDFKIKYLDIILTLCPECLILIKRAKNNRLARRLSPARLIDWGLRDYGKKGQLNIDSF